MSHRSAADVIEPHIRPVEGRLPEDPPLYAEYQQQRKEGAIRWDKSRRGWSVISFDLCKEIEDNEVLYAHPDRRDLVNDEEVYKMIQLSHGGERALILLQGAEHRAMHGSMARDISSRTRSLRPRVQQLADHYVERLGERIEFIEDLANLLPTAVISTVFDLPWLDDEQQLRVARDCTAAIGGARETLERDSQAWRDGAEGARKLSEMLMPFVLQREAAEGEDLISRFWRTGREVFDDWTADDVLAQCRTVFFAGSNSSTHFLANIMYVLATNPQLWEPLREEPKRIKVFIEEVLRVIPPVQGRVRIATEDVELDGQSVRAGDVLYLFNAAANRDPVRFDRPEMLDLEQKPRLHLTFNSGPRACAGSSTARAEGEEFVRALLRWFDGAALDPGYPAPDFMGQLNRGFAPLHLIMTRRPEHMLSDDAKDDGDR
jgi:cytochrome P450